MRRWGRSSGRRWRQRSRSASAPGTSRGASSTGSRPWGSSSPSIFHSIRTTTSTNSPTTWISDPSRPTGGRRSTFPSRDGPGHGEGGSGGEAADEDRLERAAHGPRAGEAALHVSEECQGRERDRNGGGEAGAHVRVDEVGAEGDEAARDVGAGDGQGAGDGAPWVGLLETELEAHHEIDPRLGAPAERTDDRRALLGGEAKGLEHVLHLGGLGRRL